MTNQKPTNITAIVLTFNEEQHIERCIQSLDGYVEEVVVIDSFSSDHTVDYAYKHGAKVYQHPFENHATQFNWALENCPIHTDWILRIDADEYIQNPGKIDLASYLRKLSDNVNGILISRKIVFMGKPLLHGGWYPKWNLRIFRNGKGKCENRWMDEHIVLDDGKTVSLHLDFVDENLNNLHWWTQKHNKYSDLEAADYFIQLEQFENGEGVKAKFWGNDAERKRWLKKKYFRFPLFIRPFINFIFRYIFLFGILDGKAGFVWHVLQGFWYRFLVDVKILELKKKFKHNNLVIIQHVLEKYRQ